MLCSADQSGEPPLAVDQRQVAQVVAIMLDTRVSEKNPRHLLPCVDKNVAEDMEVLAIKARDPILAESAARLKVSATRRLGDHGVAIMRSFLWRLAEPGAASLGLASRVAQAAIGREQTKMTNYAKLQAVIGGSAAAQQVIPTLINLGSMTIAQGERAKTLLKLPRRTFLISSVGLGRLIAAWGISGGKHLGARDKSRMAGSPLGAGPGYHRGHAIPHTLGGPTDINLVPQLGSVNIGPFRRLKKLSLRRGRFISAIGCIRPVMVRNYKCRTRSISAGESGWVLAHPN